METRRNLGARRGPTARRTRRDAIHAGRARSRVRFAVMSGAGPAGRGPAARRAGRMPIARASVGDRPREHGDVVEADAHAVTDREPEVGAVLHVHA